MTDPTEPLSDAALAREIEDARTIMKRADALVERGFPREVVWEAEDVRKADALLTLESRLRLAEARVAELTDIHHTGQRADGCSCFSCTVHKAGAAEEDTRGS